MNSEIERLRARLVDQAMEIAYWRNEEEFWRYRCFKAELAEAQRERRRQVTRARRMTTLTLPLRPGPRSAPPSHPPRPRQLSAEARARLSHRQKQYWTDWRIKHDASIAAYKQPTRPIYPEHASERTTLEDGHG